MTLGQGMILNHSTKQKSNSRSSTEAEIIGVDDKISKIIWAKRFIEEQGFEVNTNIVYQDNQNVIRLEENGNSIAGKRARHFDIKIFYVKDLIKQNILSMKYSSTDNMIADYLSKLLVGSKFKQMRDLLMNLLSKRIAVKQQECVGE